MRKTSRILALLVCLVMMTWTLSGCGGGSTADEAYTASEVTSELSMADEVKAFYEKVDTDYAYELTHELAYNWDELADFLGWRSAGSDAEHACADYLVEQMEEIGLENVEKVGTDCDRFQFNNSSLSIEDSDVNFEGEDVEAGTNGPASYQVDGTDGDLTAEIVDCGNGTEADYEGKDMEGKIALVQVDQWNEAWIDPILQQAAEAGAAAAVTWANSGYGEAGTYTANVQDVCSKDFGIPTVAVSADQADQIKAAMEEGHRTCTLNVDAQMDEDQGTTYNVCGMIPGKNHDQKIVVAGHYDKYWYGFQDDCAAIGLVFAVAKAMIDSGYQPENDIYFVCHGAEEWGVTDSVYDWTTGAWGMVDDQGMANDCLALLNCELPAFQVEKNLTICCVPEFQSLVSNMFEEGLLVTSGETAIEYEPVDTNTMEDGICYREYGTPYFINGFEDETFICQRYHTIADNEDTYDEDVFKTNINWFGAYAIYVDTEPALELDLQQTVAELEGNFNADYAEEAGADTEEYTAALEELKEAAGALNDRIAACNEDYEAAAADGDEEAMSKAREEGLELNQQSLEAFQEVQDNFLKVCDSWAQYGHLLENENVEILDGILAGLDAGEVWAEDEESGAADLAWQLNEALEYNYCLFSKDVADWGMYSYDQDKYKDKDQAQWGWNHMPYYTDTGDYSYELLHAETIDDVDVDALKAGYTDARKATIKVIGQLCDQEIEDMKDLAEELAE